MVQTNPLTHILNGYEYICYMGTPTAEQICHIWAGYPGPDFALTTGEIYEMLKYTSQLVAKFGPIEPILTELVNDYKLGQTADGKYYAVK